MEETVRTKNRNHSSGCFDCLWPSQVALVVKNLSANADDVRDVGSIPGSGRFPGGGHSNPLQYSCLGNPRDRGTLQVTVHGVAKSWTELSNYALTHAHSSCKMQNSCRLSVPRLASDVFGSVFRVRGLGTVLRFLS